jgi:transcriptional regulator with XRE-family HTH domain
MRNWRERLDPQRIPGLLASGRRRRVVSQEVTAQLVGVSPVWYGKLERGEQANYSDDFLDRVAYTLRLSHDERKIMYLLAVGRDTAAKARPARALGKSLVRIVEEQPWPAWISDRCWDMLVNNQHAARWFPHMEYESNIMRWVFAYPEAQLQLVDWEASWAPPMLAQMRAANARWPRDPRLEAVIQEALHNEYARHLWEAEPSVHVHPDGDRRWLHLPYEDQQTQVEIVALTPMRNEEIRLVILIPVADRPTPTTGQDSLS